MGGTLISGKSRLVKSHNLARFVGLNVEIDAVRFSCCVSLRIQTPPGSSRIDGLNLIPSRFGSGFNLDP